MVQEELKITGSEHLTSILNALTQQIHPLVLGEAYRVRSQIKMLARTFLSGQIHDEIRMEKIVNFLCAESGSHDYTIHRREARDELGLNIETPDMDLYMLIKRIYDDINKELQFTSKYDPNAILGTNQQSTYAFKRALIESFNGGSHFFISEGRLARQQIQVQPGVVQPAIQDQRSFEGWRHENG